MTDQETGLCDLLARGTDAGLLRKMIGFAAERLMELEVGGLASAAYGERSPDRLAQRNGYRDRGWETQAGTIELSISKLSRVNGEVKRRTDVVGIFPNEAEVFALELRISGKCYSN